jgi:hypothetical protein
MEHKVLVSRGNAFLLFRRCDTASLGVSDKSRHYHTAFRHTVVAQRSLRRDNRSRRTDVEDRVPRTTRNLPLYCTHAFGVHNPSMSRFASPRFSSGAVANRPASELWSCVHGGRISVSALQTFGS